MTLFEERDRIIKEIIKPEFKKAGFLISGNTLIKKEDGFVKVFDIQNCSWNMEDNVTLFFDIGFVFPIMFKLDYQQEPKKIRGYDCQFATRSSSFTGRDQAYKLIPNTNIADFENQIKNDIKDQIIPFFTNYTYIKDCLSLNNDWIDARPYVGLTLLDKGEIIEGNLILDNYIPTTTERWGKILNELRLKILKNTCG